MVHNLSTKQNQFDWNLKYMRIFPNLYSIVSIKLFLEHLFACSIIKSRKLFSKLLDLRQKICMLKTGAPVIRDSKLRFIDDCCNARALPTFIEDLTRVVI